MKKNKTRLGIVLIAVLFLLVVAACGSSAPKVVEVTREVPVTVVVTQVVQLVVTTTPLPATPTPQYTATPEPIATPVFQKWTTSQVIDAIKAAGLEIADTRLMTKDDYGIAPMTAVEGVHFLIPSLCSDCGGRILSFASQDDLDKTKSFYVDLGKSSAAFFSWVFVRDNVLIQINGDLKEDKAKQYEAALNAMK